MTDSDTEQFPVQKIKKQSKSQNKNSNSHENTSKGHKKSNLSQNSQNTHKKDIPFEDRDQLNRFINGKFSQCLGMMYQSQVFQFLNKCDGLIPGFINKKNQEKMSPEFKKIIKQQLQIIFNELKDSKLNPKQQQLVEIPVSNDLQNLDRFMKTLYKSLDNSQFQLDYVSLNTRQYSQIIKTTIQNFQKNPQQCWVMKECLGYSPKPWQKCRLLVEAKRNFTNGENDPMKIIEQVQRNVKQIIRLIWSTYYYNYRSAVKKIQQKTKNLVLLHSFNILPEDLKYDHPIVFLYVVNNRLTEEGFMNHIQLFRTFLEKWLKLMKVSFQIVGYNPKSSNQKRMEEEQMKREKLEEQVREERMKREEEIMKLQKQIQYLMEKSQKPVVTQKKEQKEN